jgi:hypothetical protein
LVWQGQRHCQLLAVFWYGKARDIVNYWYDQIRDVAVHWRNQIRDLAVFWYDGIRDFAVYWRDQIRDLVTLSAKIVAFFTASFFAQLLLFLSDPGGYIWAYIIGLIEPKLEEIFDKYW